jgi:transposase
MRAYSENLRHKIVEALERGVYKAGVSRLSGVSLSSVKRYARMAQEGWALALRKGFGRTSKIKGILRGAKPVPGSLW